MAHRGTGPLRLPPWLIGPGLVVPPFFLVLIAIVYPRPVAPVMPEPLLDRPAADRHIIEVARATAKIRLGEAERNVEALWKIHNRHRVAHQRSRGRDAAVDHAQRGLRQQCLALRTTKGTDSLLAVGDLLAFRLVRELLPAPSARDRAAIEMLGGTFYDHAVSTGLIGPTGDLRVHPIVLLVLAKVGFRRECGAPAQAGLAPIEQDALDYYRLRWNTTLPGEDRVAIARRFGQRHPRYRTAQAEAVIYLSDGQPHRAYAALLHALKARPGHITIQNNYIFVRDELGR